jgi:rsbT co-antagonist protein RsbR
MDITRQKLSEDLQARYHADLLSAQERSLAELSTPLIPISENVVAMPLIGAVDGPRATRVVETLLHGVSSARAKAAIVDLTGVPEMNTHTADALVRAARGVRLLGARLILTGIRPGVAQTLVSLGTDLDDLVTLHNLAAGLEFAAQFSD